MRGRVLIIAGSDSGGGAGIQADIKTVTALGGYAMTAITALTAQNTLGVFGIHDVPAAFVTQQIGQLVAFQVAALHQHRFGAGGTQAGGDLLHGTGAGNLVAAQHFRFRNVRGQQRRQRHQA